MSNAGTQFIFKNFKAHRRTYIVKFKSARLLAESFMRYTTTEFVHEASEI